MTRSHWSAPAFPLHSCAVMNSARWGARSHRFWAWAECPWWLSHTRWQAMNQHWSAPKHAQLPQKSPPALTASAADIAARYQDRFVHLTERRLDGGAVCLDEACAIDPATADASPDSASAPGHG